MKINNIFTILTIMTLPTKDQCREWFKTKCWNAYDRHDTDVITLNQMIETFCSEHPGIEEWMERRDHWIWKISLDIKEIKWLVKKGYLGLQGVSKFTMDKQ